MNLDDVTPLIVSYNEEQNLPRVLAALAWAKQILIVDSGSTDDTAGIAAADPRIRFISRQFEAHANQWNFGLTQVNTEWTLALDADYICPAGLAEELERLPAGRDSYFADFTYAIFGKLLRGALYPARAVLFRTAACHYEQDGHTQRLAVDERRAGRLRSKIIHDDRKPLARWLASQAKYAALEGDKLLTTPSERLGWKDRLRKLIVLAPPLTLMYCLFVKLLILDGWPGLYYSLQRTYAELLLSLELLDRRLRPLQRQSGPASLSKGRDA